MEVVFSPVFPRNSFKYVLQTLAILFVGILYPTHSLFGVLPDVMISFLKDFFESSRGQIAFIIFFLGALAILPYSLWWSRVFFFFLMGKGKTLFFESNSWRWGNTSFVYDSIVALRITDEFLKIDISHEESITIYEDMYEKFPDIYTIFNEKTHDRLVQEMLTQFKLGNTLSFGKLEISQNMIVIKGKKISQDQVFSITIQDDYVGGNAVQKVVVVTDKKTYEMDTDDLPNVSPLITFLSLAG